MRVGEFFHTYKKLVVIFTIALIACLCVFVIIFKPNQSTKRTPADIEPIALKISQNAEVGDLIFRKGLNTESDIITYISRSPFSHIGMVVSLEPFSVIHATTDDDKNAPNQVIISSLENFLAQAQAVGLRRLDLPQEIRIAMARDSLRYLAKPFVLSTDSTRFYCTTFLLEVISQQTEFEVDFINVDFAFLGGEYLFPSAFWNHHKTLKVLEVSEF